MKPDGASFTPDALPENPFTRRAQLLRLEEDRVWDCIVIGGGATGLGVAVDAATRGLQVLLLEQADFAKGTSSRSTKLVHGGVRYLAGGQLKLVYAALRERGLLLHNAPHLVTIQDFIVPCFGIVEKIKYFTGLLLYQLLSGRNSFGRVEFLSAGALLREIPVLKGKKLSGGVRYFDGQFDDARLALNLAQTAVSSGAAVLNYLAVTALIKTGGRISGVSATDLESGRGYALRAKQVINATGVFVDDVHRMEDAGAAPTVRPSQGVHLVFGSSFLRSRHALMIPRTSDGRVLFAVPWQDHVLVGTTDTPVPQHGPEPRALEKEVGFILETLQAYLQPAPARENILSVFAGLRPLAAGKPGAPTKEISRDHKITVSPSGLISVIGGKWTTYRKMAEDAVNHAVTGGRLVAGPCITPSLALHGADVPGPGGTESAAGPLGSDVSFTGHPTFPAYGSDLPAVHRLTMSDPALAEPLVSGFPFTRAMVVWAVRSEMARTVEDVLARRLRLLFLDARAALDAAPGVAAIMRKEFGKDETWAADQLLQFREVAKGYFP